MYSRGYPSQSARFSPHRRGGGAGVQSPEHNNNNMMRCPPPQWTQNQSRFRTPSPNYRGPRPNTSPSPGFQGQRSPRNSPFLAPEPRSPFRNGGGYQGSPFPGAQRSPRPSSPRHNLYPYSPSPRGRGAYGWASTSTPYHRGNGKKNFSERNPGGSKNVRDYYNPSMVEDPWRNLTPVTATKTSVATT